MLSRPTVPASDETGQWLEPYEEVQIETSPETVGVVVRC